MKLAHYIDFTYSRQAELIVGQSPILLVSNILGAVHAHNHEVAAQHGITVLAVAFPDMRENYPGRVVRVLGSSEHLEQLIAGLKISYLREAGLIARLKILAVPTEHKHASYRRDRRHEKDTVGYVERTERRYVRRAEAAGSARKAGSADDIRLARLAKLSVPSPEGSRVSGGFFIRMRSGSTEKTFSIIVCKEESSLARLGRFDSYGLTGGSDRATVPDFAR